MKQLLFTLLIVVLGGGFVSAQRTISGTVTDESGSPLIGANIIVKEAPEVGTITDIDGNFGLQIPSNAAILSVSYTGYAPKEIVLNTSNTYTITLAEGQLLDEVVLIAYGSARKEALTGAVTSIKSEDIALRSINNITNMIEGSSPGVVTTTANGQPGSGLGIRIRGFGSINATSEPLYVVDGVPYVGGTSNINPDDVENISILKDASSTALYGSRAANGVVMITTKKGKKGKNSVSLKVGQGFATRGLPEYEMVDAFQYYPMIWEGYRNQLVYPASGTGISRDSASRVASGLTSRTSVAGLLAYNPFNVPANQIVGTDGKINSSAQLIYGDDLDWTKDLLRLGDRKDYVLSFNGGADKVDYFLSAGYLKEDGYTLNTDFERFTARLNVNVQPKEWLRTGLNISGNHTNSNTARDESSTTFVNPFFFSRNIGPIYPVFAHNMTTGAYLLDPATGQPFWDLGNFGNSGFGIPNRPGNGFAGRHALAETTLNSQIFTRSVASARSTTELIFLKNFKFTNNIGVDIQFQGDDGFENTLVGDGAPAGRSRRETTTNLGLIATQLLGYVNDFGKSNVDFLIGHESYKQKINNLYGFKQGQSLSGNTELNNFTTINSLTSQLDNYRVESYFSRASYNFDDRYILSASLRRDGNSRFADGARWGSFWSVGGAWNIHKENFFDVSWVNNLKLRSSYGVTGVADGIGYYAYQGLYGFANNANEPGLLQSTTAFLNTNLTWENNVQFDLGIDFGFFKDRISGSIEYFNRQSKDLLFEVPQPLSSGISTTLQNTATMFNKGIEANLNVELVKTRDLLVRLNINASTLTNEITEMPELVPSFITGTKKYEVGSSIFDYWLRSYHGIDPSDGAVLYKADNTATTTGRRIIGSDTLTTTVANGKFAYNGSVIPDFYGSFSPSIKFKGITVGALFTFQIGGLTYDALYQSLMSASTVGGALHKDILNRWQNEGDITNVPRMDQGRAVDFNATSSRWLVDASYLNIRNINLSYDLPKSLLTKLKVTNSNIFLSMENVAFFSKRVGMNNQQAFSGVTSNAYPPARVFSGGFNLTF